ncbi:beta-ketoacyl-[acyl-carrier-protein] synthase family protein [Zobellia galactanivorans]|uniref:3-oxoacyl-[acyl-carrier-protein] synthase 1 n=1 Tax=Zobellia galactanivorans (strain DSM 12802 / CCUG 47099 / CIP 106680 / NCIMB 13871 / Dsij) TaxID=63186 RepID=G0L3M9_ZOBGA|nr:beta-ketoacyl-[acyl-carrier-protein] synthase family protein [Zobellia galactanivorans]CAZ98519.1 3-oxoacyl-[acyl-carrier-protein] synthase [Zobellia galactanivorans]
MRRRVVITGMGVCAPNGIGLGDFAEAMAVGKSGIRFQPGLKELEFGCQIAAQPELTEELLARYFTPLQLRGLNATGIMYGVIAGSDAWKDAGLAIAEKEAPDWDSGVLFGSGTLGVAKFREAIHQIDAKNVRRLGSTSVIQTMASGVSAYLGGILGCGNQVTTNSSACTTGTEGVLMGYERIAQGQAERMLVGSCSDSGPYVWAGFDAMRILPRQYNDRPEAASRPMSATAAGFVPGSGAGALLLESLESARARGAHIYAEILGGAVNSGGQRGDGSMTAPNSEAVQRCILQAIGNSGIDSADIDAINGHLTATGKDALEIANWSAALGRSGTDFPYVNSFKGYFGHCLSAAGSIECVAAVLQFEKEVLFGNLNCEDVHPEISKIIDQRAIPQKSRAYKPSILAKASFGFGDVNACVIFKRYTD